MTLARRVGGLERKVGQGPCGACVDAPDLHVVKDEREALPTRCVRCGREIRCFTIIGIDLEEFGAPPETIAGINEQVASFRRRQGLA